MPGYPAPGYRAPSVGLMGPVGYRSTGTDWGAGYGRGFQSYGGGSGATGTARFWLDPAPVSGFQGLTSGAMGTGAFAFGAAHGLRPAFSGITRALQAIDNGIASALNAAGASFADAARTAKYQGTAQDAMMRAFRDFAQGASGKEYGPWGARPDPGTYGPFGRAGTQSGMDILRRFLKDEGGFLKLPKDFPGFAALLEGVGGAPGLVALLMSQLLEQWFLSGNVAKSNGGYVLDVPPGWAFGGATGPCPETHEPPIIYWPAYETTEVRPVNDANIADPWHTLPSVGDPEGRVGVWAKSYAYRSGSPPILVYPALAYDLFEWYAPVIPSPDPITVPYRYAPYWYPTAPEPQRVSPYRWANPWPALDPFHDPRTAPGGLPLGLEGYPIPYALIPYRWPSASPEASVWGYEAPDETRPRWAPVPVPPGFAGPELADPTMPDIRVNLPPGEPPRVTITPPEFKPPGDRPGRKPNSLREIMKARRLTLPGAKMLVARAFANATEAGDLADCAYGALAPGDRLRYRPGNPITMDEKIAHAAQNASKIDAGKLVQCLIKNEVEDRVIGGLNAAADRGLIKPPPGWAPGAGSGFWRPFLQSGYGVR